MIQNPPFPHHKHIRVLLCYKNFSKDCSVSHIGLGVTCSYTAKTLCAHGYNAQALPIYGADDLTTFIEAQEKTSYPVTHVVICAQWIPIRFLSLLARRFPHVQFAQNCHSQVAFLQAEPPAIDLLRGAIDLEMGITNFRASSNSQRLCQALRHMYNHPVMYLPNLYYLHGSEPVNRPTWNGGLLKIGCFGSLRIYKNFSVAIAAAIELSNRLKSNHTEIWINDGRNDGAGNVVYRTAHAWTHNVPHVRLKQLHWASWPEFRRVVGSCNILLQPSFTETFNNVTADGIAEGTPSVVGPSIEWVPSSWQAEPDDSSQVAEVARHILMDHHAASEGYNALRNFVKKGLPHWAEFLSK